MPSPLKRTPAEESAGLAEQIKTLREDSALQEQKKELQEKHREQTVPARKKRAANRKEEADKKARKQTAQAEAELIAEEKERIKALRQSITEEMILAEMRPLRRYNAKSKSYSKAPDKCMHTLKSAELAILKEGYTPEATILSLPKKGWSGPPIRGVTESNFDPFYNDPSQVPDIITWKSWVFFNGYRYENFPVPPPPTEGVPIIEDEKWDDLLQQSRAYSWLADSTISKWKSYTNSH